MMAPLERDRSFGSAELWELLRRAGYSKPTPLQRKVVPLIHSGRDLAVEVQGDAGKTAAFILPLMARLKRGRAGIKAVVVTSSAEDSRKTEREFHRFQRPSAGRSVVVFALGEEPSDRSEHRSLVRQPDVLIGTPRRIIDHIRRGNLDFSLLNSVVIDRKGEDPEFDDDLQFIFSKLPPNKQTILFTPVLEEAPPELIGLLRRPVLIGLAAWKQSETQPEELFIEVAESGKEAAVAALVLTEAAPALLIQCADPEAARRISKTLEASGLKTQCLLEETSAGEQARTVERFGAGQLPILVGTFEAVRRRAPRGATVVINADPPPSPETYRPQSLVLEKVISLGSAAEQRRLQESCRVKPKPSQPPTLDQALSAAVRRIVANIRSEADLQELRRYRRLLRRSAPLALRSYVGPYLLRAVYGQQLARLPVQEGPTPQAPAAGGRPARKPASGFTRLFINAGKSRGIFARDLAAHFTSTLKVDRCRIGQIRVLDNYSFLEIDSALAEKAISSLSGTQLKGRQITVNYARKREDE